MQKFVLLHIVALLCSSVSATQFSLSEPLGTKWFQDFKSLNSKVLDTGFAVNRTTVSGFSSGAALTGNIMALDGTKFDGAAILSGAVLNVYEKNGILKPREITGKNLKDKPIYLYQGSLDTSPITNPQTFKFTQQFFENANARLAQNWVDSFKHVFPNDLPPDSSYNPKRSCTDNKDLNAEDPKKGFNRNCGFDLANYMFSHLLSQKNDSSWFFSKDADDFGNSTLNEKSFKYQDYGDFVAFDQQPFSTPEAKMHSFGYLYVPFACQNGAVCHLHTHLHGCTQSAKKLKDVYVRATGFLEYAATNNIILLFPQNDDYIEIQGEKSMYCWSSMYTNDIDHPQIQAIMKMTNSLIGTKVKESGADVGLLKLSAFDLILYTVIAPLVIIFAFFSALPRWISKTEKWYRDFQYLIHGVFVLKLLALSTDIVNKIFSVKNDVTDQQIYNIDFLKIFAFNGEVLLASFYVYFFMKALSRTDFTGRRKRLPFHFIIIFGAIAVGVIDALMHNTDSRIYVPYREKNTKKEKNPYVDYFDRWLRYFIVTHAGMAMVWARGKLYKQGQGIIYQTLKAYFKRCDLIVAISLSDLTLNFIFDIHCRIGKQKVQASEPWRVIYTFANMIQIYILVACIKIRHTEHIYISQQNLDIQGESLLKTGPQGEAQKDSRSTDNSSSRRAKKVALFDRFLEPQNLLFAENRRGIVVDQEKQSSKNDFEGMDFNGLEKTSLGSKFLDSSRKLEHGAFDSIITDNTSEMELIHSVLIGLAGMLQTIVVRSALNDQTCEELVNLINNSEDLAQESLKSQILDKNSYDINLTEFANKNPDKCLESLQLSDCGKINIVEYAPNLFKLVRRGLKTEHDILKALIPSHNQDAIRNFQQHNTQTQKQKRKRFFFFSDDQSLLIKTMDKSEMDVLFKTNFLNEYVLHLMKNTKSLLARILGVYEVNVPGQEPIYLLITVNQIGTDLDAVQQLYALHGTYDAQNEYQPLEIDLSSEKSSISILGDQNFMDSTDQRSRISAIKKQNLSKIIQSDTQLLLNNGLVGYSLFLVEISCMSSFDYKSYKSLEQRNTLFMSPCGKRINLIKASSNQKLSGQQSTKNISSTNTSVQSPMKASDSQFISRPLAFANELSSDHSTRYKIGIIDFLRKQEGSQAFGDAAGYKQRIDEMMEKYF